MFGLVHATQGQDPASIAGIVAITGLGGLLFGWLFVRWDFNLWPPILLHIGMNSLWIVFALGDDALGGWLGNALRLIYHYGDSIRFCHQTETWHIWNGRQWKPDDSGEIMRTAMATGETIYAESESVPSDELRKGLRKWATATEGERKLVAMERLGLHPRLVEGREDNLKVTTPADLALAEFLLSRR